MSSLRRSLRHTSSRRRETTDLPKTITVPDAMPRSASAYSLSSGNSAATALVLAFCLASILQFSQVLNPSRGGDGGCFILPSLHSLRRSLLGDAREDKPTSIYIIPVAEPASDQDLGILWQEPPFSSGVNSYYQCMGKRLTGKVGDVQEEITSIVDVDEDWSDGIMKQGLSPTDISEFVKSGQVDDLVVITDQPLLAVNSLLSEKQHGRMLGLFRHPVERMADRLSQLKSDKEHHAYQEYWSKMSLLEWMTNITHIDTWMESDMMVKKIVGAKPTDTVHVADLRGAMDFVKEFVVVGLMSEPEESLRRFNMAMGSGDHLETNCTKELFYTDSIVFDQEASIAPNSPEWNAIAKRSPLDMMLYNLIEKLFEEQYEIFGEFSEPQVSEHLTWWSDKLDTSHLSSVDRPFSNREMETPFYWHVPRAGGSHLQDFYWCMDFTLANQVGGENRFQRIAPHHLLTQFQPWKAYGNEAKVINVDMSTRNGIVHAKNLGFLSQKDSPRADIIFSSQFYDLSVILFSNQHKARMFALFRHPVERAVSRFTSLQKVNPTWVNLSVVDWATQHTQESNWMVRQLVGKIKDGAVDIKDLEVAKGTVRSKFIVGLFDKYQESLHRFNVLLGVDENNAKVKDCLQSNAPPRDTKGNHSRVEEGSPTYVTLMSVNFLDAMLYRYVEELFESQTEMFKEHESVGAAQ